MKGKILTVTVPAYNVQDFLEDCLESFVNSEAMDDTEILIVNDGSTDSTENLARRYADKYPETFRIISKENGGHGSTINTGIQEATGKYFKVVDGDDWVDTRNFIKLVKKLEETDADIVANNYTWMNYITRLPERRQERPFTKVKYNHLYNFAQIVGKTTIGMHAMTIKTELLKQCGEKIDEHTFYVDAEYITFPIPYAETVLFLEEPVYCYRLGRPDQSMSIEKMQRNLKNHLRVLMHLNEYVNRVKDGLSAEKICYMNELVAEILTSQIKIYISFPLGSGMQKKVRKLDAFFYRNNRMAYSLVKNPAVLLMRKTNYAAFPLVVAVFKYRRNSY